MCFAIYYVVLQHSKLLIESLWTPEVDVEIVRAGSPDAVLGTAELLDQLDTATLALPDGRHVLHGEGVVERILAP